MGGQLMPPVMGAVAFIMAETLGRRICRGRQGGADPGDPLFRLAPSGWCIWRRAGTGWWAWRRTTCPRRCSDPREGWYLILPLGVLVYLLFSGYTPLFAGHDRPGADGAADPRRLGRRSACPSAVLRIIFWIGARPGRGVVLPIRHRPVLVATRGAGRVERPVERRARDADRCAAMRWPMARRPRCRSASPARWSASSSAP